MTMSKPFCGGGFKLLNESMKNALNEQGEPDFKPLAHGDLSKYI